MTYFVFPAIYKHYDGIIWPEILDDKSANESLWAKAKHLVGWKSTPIRNEEDASSHGGNIKNFSPQDHTDFRKDALIFYLHDLVNDFAGITGSNDPIQIIRMMYAVYASMCHCYLCYDKKQHVLVFEEIIEVRTYV